MARGIQKWTPKTIERLRLEGRGQGEGKTYKPWIDVATISSLGRSHRVFSPKTGRQHELLSDVEWHLFLLLEWADDVIDIREQYPLDSDLTQEIASAIGIRHPFYPGTHVPTVMTADFLVTRRQNNKQFLEAFNSKLTEEAEDERSLEKLEIQRTYFNGMDIPHHLIFSSTILKQKVKTIEWIRSGYVKEGEIEPYPGCYDDHVIRMANELSRSVKSLSLNEYCENYDLRCGLPIGTALRVAKILMHAKTLSVDLDNPKLGDSPLASFRICKPTNLHLYVGGL